MKFKTKKDGSHGVISNAAYAYKSVWEYKKSLVFCVIAYAASSASIGYIWSFVTKFIIDDVASSAPISHLVKTVIFAGLFSLAFMVVIDCTNEYFWPTSAFVMFKLRKKYNSKFMKMDYEKLENTEMLDKAEKAIKGCNWGGGMMGMVNISQYFLRDIIIVIVAAVIITSLNPWLLLLFSATGILKAVMQTKTKIEDKKACWDKMAPYYRKIRYLGQVQSDFSYAKDVRLFNMRSFLKSKHVKTNAEAHKLLIGHKNRWLKWEMKNYVITFAEFLMQYGYLVYSLCFRDLDLGNFVLYGSVISNYSDSIRYMFDNFAELKFRTMEVDDYRAFVDIEPMSDAGKKTSCRSVPKTDKYIIEFKNVSFKYKGSENYALKNINIKLESGKSLAVVGLNGAGKSTFIKLLCRLYDASEGEILLNGVNVQEFNKEEYFELFSPVFQNVELFALTLGENTAMSSWENVDEKKALASLCDSGLSDKLEKLPEKLKTQVLKNIYEDGVDFSGGEKQKLALARALYKGAPIMLLDEPTAALDPIAEYELYKSFDKIVGGKLAVYISHRLSSTRFCDSIAMFENGCLTESGTHEELLSANGAYSELFKVQAQYYKDKEQQIKDGMESEAIVNG